jgi:hypothetical protein
MQDHLTEEWRPVPSYEGWYSISNLGRVRRERKDSNTWSGRILKPQPNGRPGYLQVILSRQAQKHVYRVHRLVAFAFLGPCPEGYEVNHKDGVKANNSASNLEYETPRGNIKHSFRLGLQPSQQGSRNPHARLTEDAVRKIRAAIGTHEEIAQRFAASRSAVSLIKERKRWKHVS